jgi:hypothetical protein
MKNLRLAILRARLRFISWRLYRLEARWERITDRIDSILDA